MIYTIQNTLKRGHNICVLDCANHAIKLVLSYDSETREVQTTVETIRMDPQTKRPMIRFAKQPDGTEVALTFVLPGSRIMIDGMEEVDFLLKNPGFGSGLVMPAPKKLVSLPGGAP